MAVKQTAGRDALGEFAPNLRNLTMRYYSGRCGAERINSPSETAAL